MSLKRIMLINGPNLNLLGEREEGVYGRTSWAEIEEAVAARAGELGCEVVFRQSNHEGDLVDWVQEARSGYHGLIINPGALTHYSYALQDALRALPVRAVEVHLSNIFAREEWRARSLVSPAVEGVVCGFGPRSYLLALEAVAATPGGEINTI